MSSVGRVLAGTWLWGFVLLVDLVLLNMVLAILMDAYGAVKSHASVMTTVPHQISEMLRRRRLTREKKRVRLSDIWFAYLNKFKDAEEMLASQAMVMPEDLVKQVPGLQMAQAKRTMSHAMMQQDDNDSRYGVHQMGLQIKMCNMRAKILQEEVLAIRSALEEVRLAAEPLPSPSHLGLKESTVRIVEILKTSVGGLRDQVDGVLQDEMQIHEMRQYQLQDEQRAMRLCAQDAKAKLKAMLRRLEGLSTTLEKHVTKEQVTSVFGNGRPQEGVSLARSLAVCSEPTRGQVTMS
ncbi:unnamed protein product [Effrenium voratum]|uniref:Uncharacterized protein n=1 Tax=Effrenium voratum TaxID=2562239 RepID=A0AA36JAH2_9DINO|nr:unnamed protein product [Effrenium voratum]